MKTILIPVDFSETSKNAIEYAANLTLDIEVDRIILLKSFNTNFYAELLPSPDYIQKTTEELNEERRVVIEQLKSLGKELQDHSKSAIKVETAISEQSLLRSLRQIIKDEKPDLLIVGSDNLLTQSYIGAQLIAIVRTTTIPTLIVPSTFKYEQIKKALIPCDFKVLSRLDSLKNMADPLKWIKPELNILNVDPDLDHLAHEEDVDILKEFMEGYHYKIHYSEDPNIVHGILEFTKKNEVQLMIALPGKYSFFYNFTHSSITEAITLNSLLPVLILK
ncbi:universal stress protein [Pedobacter sp. L105]|uniref:universal stress protein n=1 Tax=Pedobacter sp. L105 TaxID=1641871 RepID=UPI00131D174A|nr:universal stress protein [Pedobacter sp. L105]